MRTPQHAIEIAIRILNLKFPEADCAICAGSIMRGEGTPSSDIDLIVLHAQLPHAWRESFVFDGWPVEAFAHDLETFHYFAMDDAKSGTPHLAQMATEGTVVPKASPLSRRARELSAQILQKGPPPLSEDDFKHSLYGLTDLIDDLLTPRSVAEVSATGAALYRNLADFYLRSQNQWSAVGKWIPRRLMKVNKEFALRFENAFQKLFANAETDDVVALATEVIRPFGGPLFDGYRRDAPADWRLPLKY